MKVKEKTTTKKKNKGKTALKVIAGILVVILVLTGVATVANSAGNKGNIEKIAAFESGAKENQLVPEKDEKGNWTFTTDEDFKVLQITDIHIGGGFMSLKKDAMALNAVAAMVKAEQPDLVIATGDIAYPVPFQAGTFNNLPGAEIFATLMEQLGVYWTIIFGSGSVKAILKFFVTVKL